MTTGGREEDARVPTRRYAVLQAGRGVAALSVVVFHAGQFVGVDSRFWREAWLAHVVQPGWLGVPFFFVLSGMVLMLAHGDETGKRQRLGRYAWKRFRRIYPMYWLVLAPVLAAYVAGQGHGLAARDEFWVVLSSVSLVPIGTLDSVLLVAWTLYHEVMFYVVFGVLVASRRVGLVAMGLWLGGSVVAFFQGLHGRMTYEYLSPLHLLFGLGMMTVWGRSRWGWPRWPLPVAVGAALVGYAGWWTGAADASGRAWSIELIAGLGCCVLLQSLMELEAREELKVWGWLGLVGDASYSIYLVHVPALSVCFRVMYWGSHRVALPVWVWMMGGTVVAAGVGVVMHVVVERRVLALPGRWSGD